MPLTFKVPYDGNTEGETKIARFSLKAEITGPFSINVGAIESPWPVTVEATSKHIIALLEQNDMLREEVLEKFQKDKEPGLQALRDAQEETEELREKVLVALNIDPRQTFSLLS